MEDESGQESVFYTDTLRERLDNYDRLIETAGDQSNLIRDILLRDHQLEALAEEPVFDSLLAGSLGCLVLKLWAIAGVAGLLGLVWLIQKLTQN